MWSSSLFVLPLPPRSTLLPYTTLFRSAEEVAARHRPGADGAGAEGEGAQQERARRSGAGADRGRPEADGGVAGRDQRSEEHTSELQSPCNLVCRLLLEKKKHTTKTTRV